MKKVIIIIAVILIGLVLIASLSSNYELSVDKGEVVAYRALRLAITQGALDGSRYYHNRTI